MDINSKRFRNILITITIMVTTYSLQYIKKSVSGKEITRICLTTVTWQKMRLPNRKSHIFLFVFKNIWHIQALLAKANLKMCASNLMLRCTGNQVINQ